MATIRAASEVAESTGMLATKSLTVIVQVVLNTQLTAGKPTLTTPSTSAPASCGHASKIAGRIHLTR